MVVNGTAAVTHPQLNRMNEFVFQEDLGIDLGRILTAPCAGPLVEQLVDEEIIAVRIVQSRGLHGRIGSIIVGNIQNFSRGIRSGIEYLAARLDRADVVADFGAEFDV